MTGTLEIEHRSEIILRSSNCIRLAHRERPEHDVAKGHLPPRVVTPNPYANFETPTVGSVEREVDVDGVHTRSFRLKTRRAELPPGESIDKECVPSGFR